MYSQQQIDEIFEKYLSQNDDEIELLESIQDYLPLPKIVNLAALSQSTMKNAIDCQNGKICPKQFLASLKDDKALMRDNHATAMGQRFEYELTGARLRDGSIPGEFLTEKRGVKSAAQLLITRNAQNARNILIQYEFDLENDSLIGQKIVSNGLTGTIDIITNRNGKRCIVDIKYSGLLQNKWEAMAWNTEHYGRDNHIYKNENAIIQACHYLVLCREYDIDEFYFAIFDSRADHEGEYLIIKMEMSEDKLKEHLHNATLIIDYINGLFLAGEIVKPSFRMCSKCGVQDCSARVTQKEIYTVRL